MTTIHEWQRLAWALGAHDIAVDTPAEPGSADAAEQIDFRAWAERVHGAEARKLIVAVDALASIRAAATAPAVTRGGEQGSGA